MAQTKSASGRSTNAAASRGRSSANGRSSPQAKAGSRSSKQSSSSSIASKLKTPAIAAGAATAGLVGGLTLAGRGSPKKLLGLPLANASATRTTSQNLAEAAKQVGSFGERLGELATEIRLVREGVANTHKRSPIEVVLQGLTSRGIK